MAVQLKTLNGYAFNASALGGVEAGKYALKTDTAPDSEKLGGLAAEEYALTPVLLWENASPTSPFAAQTISLGLSNYTEIEVEFRHNYSDDTSNFQKARVGAAKAFIFVMESGDTYTYTYTRQFIPGVNGVEFLNGCFFNGNTTTAQNERIVPVKIYGIRG